MCCLSDGGPGGAGGGSEDGAGDHQLVPRRLTPPQPPPRLLPALPEGAVQLLQNTPHVPGHPTEYRHCKRERERVSTVHSLDRDIKLVHRIYPFMLSFVVNIKIKAATIKLVYIEAVKKFEFIKVL